jgi:hypothetical protein
VTVGARRLEQRKTVRRELTNRLGHRVRARPLELDAGLWAGTSGVHLVDQKHASTACDNGQIPKCLLDGIFSLEK